MPSLLPLLALLLLGCGPTGSAADAGGGRDADDPPAADADVDGSSRRDGGTLPDGGSPPDGEIPTVELPFIHDLSGAPPEHVRELVTRAITGLGFARGDPSAPRVEDRFFVGRRYMAWIDQTGFYGKMNGLWRLIGSGAELDFAVIDGSRPVNFFIVAEGGDGRWPPGYPGAEHVEFPNRTPEPGDDPGCASRDWCDQYAVAEASQITDPDIPWWSACNAGSPSFDELFEPIEVVESGTSVRLVYEGRLVKEADGDGRFDGDNCHEDYLFPDGVRRPVYLRLGYELNADEDYFDRLMQIRNPPGNPAFDGPMSLIGGFVITAWPSPHPLKRMDAYLRPELRDIDDPTHGITLRAGVFNAHAFSASSRDEVFAWMDQPFTMSVADAFVAGRTATLSHVGPSDNRDVGICFCSVHGAIEMGGGLIHGGISLPIGPGESTIEARRRLALPGTPGVARRIVYEAETDLGHEVGRAEADGWAASTSTDAPGHLAYGPYATDWGGGSARVTFELMVDDVRSDDLVVATLDVYDATADEILASRDVRRMELAAPLVYQPFALDVDLAARSGHSMETRVYWRDVAYVRLDRVVVALP